MESIQIDILLNTANSANNIKDLKQSIKDLTNAAAGLDEGSEEFRKLSEAAGQAKDKINGVKDAIKAQTGEPIEKVTGSLKNMGAQLAGLDFKGAAASLQAFGGNLKALPFGEILSGIKAFGSQMLILGAELLLNPIFLLTAAIAAIGFALVKAYGEAGDAAEELNKKLDDFSKKVDSFYDRQIKLAKASGKETEAIEKKKLEISTLVVNKQIENLEKASHAFGGLNDEQTKLLDDLREKSKDIFNEIEVITRAARKKTLDDTIKKNEETIAATKKLQEANAKAIEENQKALDVANEKNRARLEKERQDKLAAYNKSADDLNAQIDKEEALKKQQAIDERNIEFQQQQEAIIEGNALVDAEDQRKVDVALLKSEESFANKQALLDAQMAQELDNTNLTEEQILLIKQDYAEKAKALRTSEANATLDIAQTTTQSLSSLSDLYFAVKSANTKKGSAEDLANAKKQFKINKALSITSAVISGIQGVVNALSAQSVVPEPFGTVLKVATAVGVGLAAAANVAKIAGTQFNEGGGGGGSAAVAAPAAGPSGSFQAQGLQKIGGSQTIPTPS